MSKYQTEAGIECTPEECKLIDSLKRLAKKWEKDGKRLWLYSASGSLHVMMHGDTDNNPTPEFTQYGGSNIARCCAMCWPPPSSAWCCMLPRGCSPTAAGVTSSSPLPCAEQWDMCWLSSCCSIPESTKRSSTCFCQK